MNKRIKRKLYKSLTDLLGPSQDMSSRMTHETLILLRGWLDQKMGGSRGGLGLPDHRRLDTIGDLTQHNIFKKNFNKSLKLFRPPSSHWQIAPAIRRIAQTKQNHRLGVPEEYLYRMDTVVGRPWGWLDKSQGKSLTILIPVNYGISVAKHGLWFDGRKVVQRIWDHRSYTNHDVWRCAYWDFSKLTREENSYINARHCEGYVVKTQTHIFIDETLSKAVSLSNRRTVMAGIKSVLSDV